MSSSLAFIVALIYFALLGPGVPLLTTASTYNQMRQLGEFSVTKILPKNLSEWLDKVNKNHKENRIWYNNTIYNKYKTKEQD